MKKENYGHLFVICCNSDQAIYQSGESHNVAHTSKLLMLIGYVLLIGAKYRIKANFISEGYREKGERSIVTPLSDYRLISGIQLRLRHQQLRIIMHKALFNDGN